MKTTYLLLTAASLAIVSPALANTAETSVQAAGAATKSADEDSVSTGVARARDRLDSATSTSSLKEGEIFKLAPRSLGEIFRNIPGMHAEAPGGEGNSNLTIRGLPLALGGAKFLQIQEDGLPTLEFGDIAFGTADNFLRADLNLAAVESIRGGSASTFASNSPGGIINLISKTGDVEGGAVEGTAGLDYGEYRMDFDYGARITDTLRFHVGGFYRQGEGPRHAGFDAFKGGQVKFNVTKDFSGGYIRIYGKYLDDRTPSYDTYPLAVSGTNAKPKFSSLPGFDIRDDSLLTRNFTSNVVLGANNTLERHAMSDGIHAKVSSLGLETQFALGDWTVLEKARFSKNSGRFMSTRLLSAVTPAVAGAQAQANSLAGAGAVLRYATGPNAGQIIANPATLNGNGLLAKVTLQDNDIQSLDNFTNDIRISRVWDVGAGDLTTTAGFYKSSQDIKTAWTWTSLIMDVRGDGEANLIDLTTAAGVPVTQNGYYGYNSAFINGSRRVMYDLNYGVNAPYASFNYHIGKLSVGGSIRYDFGTVRGSVFGSELGGGRINTGTFDINGNGVISAPETRVGMYSLTQPGPVHYDYHYLSYSTGVNYRVSEPFAAFARYSRGARANADRLMFGGFVNVNSGALINPDAAFDPVQQAEAGLKYRKDGVTLNVTGFWAKTKEHNIGLDRRYRAYGIEFEGGLRKGPWQLNAGATWTQAKITEDRIVAANVGHTPRHQPDLIFQVSPQYNSDVFSIGAFIIGQTSSYSQDVNQLKLPGFTTVNGFVQVRPTDRVTLSLNANNLFNVKGLFDLDQASIPSSGIVTGRSVNGRTISTSVRFGF